MKSILKTISFAALALTLVPAFLVLWGYIEPSFSKTLMLIGTIVWFGTASFWMNKADESEEEVNS